MYNTANKQNFYMTYELKIRVKMPSQGTYLESRITRGNTGMRIQPTLNPCSTSATTISPIL